MGISDTRRRREVAWKPRMKDRKRRGPVAAGPSSRVAEAAIANLQTIDRRLRKGLEVDDRYLEKVARVLDPTAAERQAQSAGPRKRAVTAGIGWAAAAVTLVGLLAFSWSLLGSSTFGVSGNLLLDSQPVGNVELAFHPTGEEDREPIRTRTSETGAFRVAALPRGAYVITLPADSAPAIPALYAKPATTRFRLKLDRDLSNIQLYVSSKPPRR